MNILKPIDPINCVEGADNVTVCAKSEPYLEEHSNVTVFEALLGVQYNSLVFHFHYHS